MHFLNKICSWLYNNENYCYISSDRILVYLFAYRGLLILLAETKSEVNLSLLSESPYDHFLRLWLP